ncbi:hypothetical protein F4553_005375 [Allocatelliglobosispora scoriae]|uniref:Uncharacterized protein n=1 Tax=Allocatelliglobosispora scoriae TaxID=643052 RepID=A0A841BWV6_9ACTN|nr:hypothetical protein [Allocatelliglobosispora scoriae]MBB5871996.1 hypothetical protein [Allocatelliglobosispora scoriae]
MTAPTLTAPAQAPTFTREQVLDTVLDIARRLRLPAPESITMWTHCSNVTIRLPDNERGQVDMWMAALKVPGQPTAHTGFVVFACDPRALILYGTGDGQLSDAVSPLLPGVRVTVECHVGIAVDPHVHGNGFTLPPTAR